MCSVPTCTRQPRVETWSWIGVEGEENLRDEVQKEREGVMILKRCPKLKWRASDDKLWTIFNRLAHQQDNGGNQYVAPEPDPRRIDWLRKACGLNAKARAVTTPGDKKRDNYDETFVECEWSNILLDREWWGWYFVAADIPLRYICEAHGRWLEPTEDMCAMYSWTQSVNHQKYDWTLQSTRSSSHHHPSKTRPDEHHDQFWSSRPLLRMMTCEMTNTENTKSILILCFRPYLWDISVHNSVKPHYFEIETRKMTLQDSWYKIRMRVLVLNETNDQLLNTVRARSEYLHNSKNQRQSKIVYTICVWKLNMKRKFTFRLSAWSIVRIFFLSIIDKCVIFWKNYVVTINIFSCPH